MNGDGDAYDDDGSSVFNRANLFYFFSIIFYQSSVQLFLIVF